MSDSVPQIDKASSISERCSREQNMSSATSTLGFDTVMNPAEAAVFLASNPRPCGSGKFRRYRVKMQTPGCFSRLNGQFGGVFNTGGMCERFNACGCCDEAKVLVEKGSDEFIFTKGKKQKGFCC